MRIIVFSDTHGNYSAMHKIFKRNGDADLFIFLGDGERDLDSLRVQYLDKKDSKRIRKLRLCLAHSRK